MRDDKVYRIIVKEGAGAPTIPVSNDHTDGTWIATDIYEGEFYRDTISNKLWNRSGGVLIDLTPVNGLTSVDTDGSLTGDGTITSPLSVLVNSSNTDNILFQTPSGLFVNKPLTDNGISGDGLNSEIQIDFSNDANNKAILGSDSGLYVGPDASKQNLSEKGQANGYASLDSSGLVPSSQLPSYVDDVLEFANLSLFPVTGENGKIYVANDTGLIYRWSGSIYVSLGAGAPTNLSYTANPTNGAVSNTNGSGFNIPLAGAVNSGLFAPAEKTLVNNLFGTARIGTTITVNTTLTTADFGKIYTCSSTTPITVTLPTVTSANVGREFTFNNFGTNTVTFTPVITNFTSYILPRQTVTFVVASSNDWIAKSHTHALINKSVVTTNQSTSLITFSNILGFGSTIPNGANQSFKAILLCTTSAAANGVGVRINLTNPIGGGAVIASCAIKVATAVTPASALSEGDIISIGANQVGGTQLIATAGGVGGSLLVIMEGVITNTGGTVPCSMDLQISSEVAGSTITVLTGSHFTFNNF